MHEYRYFIDLYQDSSIQQIAFLMEGYPENEHGKPRFISNSEKGRTHFESIFDL